MVRIETKEHAAFWKRLDLIFRQYGYPRGVSGNVDRKRLKDSVLGVLFEFHELATTWTVSGAVEVLRQAGRPEAADIIKEWGATP